jgi:squalene-associated FAD-dependent desaturase
MPRRVLVIGGGAAGLTAAFRLAQQGHRISVVDQAQRLGGRLAASADSGGGPVPPVVIMGWHHATLALLADLRAEAPVRLLRPALQLRMSSGRVAAWPRPPLPAPLRLVVAAMIFRGLRLGDRWRFVTWVERTWEKDPALPADLGTQTAEAWLRTIGQSATARNEVWTPVSRFLLGEDLATVSASALLAALRAAFFSKHQHGHLVIPGEGLDQFLLEPLRADLARLGATISLNRTLSAISCDAHRVTGVKLLDGETMVADWYVAAVPHHALTPLLPERVLTRFSYFHDLGQLVDSPAVFVELTIGHPIAGSRLMLMADRSFHWMVANPAGQSCIVSLVATGTAHCLEWSDDEVMKRAAQDVHAAMPHLDDKPIRRRRLLRVRRAFLSLRPGVHARRPLQQSPLPNLLLAGDWTDTGLPSTLDSAVRSGNLCAEAIAAKESSQP